MYDRLQRWFSTISKYGKALYNSFYSSVLYVDVVKHWCGSGMGYLLFLIILGSIPLSGRVIVAFNQFFNEQIVFPIQALPSLTIQDGEINYNQPMPYLIRNNNGDVVSIIDTKGTVSEMKQAYPQLTVLITKNRMDFRPPSYKKFLGLAKDNIGNPVYTHAFDKGSNGLFTGAEWIDSTGMYKLNTIIKIMIFPCVTIFYFAVFGAILFLLSALVQLYSDIFFSLKLPFKAACRLLAIASTPTLVLFFFMRYGNFVVTGMSLTYSVLLLSYISFGLHSVKRQKA